MHTLFEPIDLTAFKPRLFPKWETPERSLVLVMIIVVMTTLAAIAMLPNAEEKAQVLISQGRPDDAIALFEQKREIGRLNPFEAYSLAGLYRSSGRSDALEDFLKQEIVRQSDDDWARAMLVALYRDQGRLNDEAEALSDVMARTPSSTDFRRLVVLYRLLGDRDGERAALEIGRREKLATPADLRRLDTLNSPQADAAPSVLWRSADGITQSETAL